MFIDILFLIFNNSLHPRSLQTSDNNITLVKLNDNDMKNIIKKVSILYDKLFDIMDLINYTFGIQSMIITVITLGYGIHSIFTSFLVMFGVQPGVKMHVSYLMFFSLYYHFYMLSICVIDNLISNEVK